MNISEERKREIRESEIRLACADIASVLAIDADLYENLAWVFWEYGHRIRQQWASRDFETLMRESWREYERDERAQQSLEAKLQRLIDHPSTPEPEREAARLALERIS